MPKIICELENASKEINGIKFVVGEDGRLISESDVGEPHLSIFLSIPGYSAEGEEDAGGDATASNHQEPAQDKEPAKPKAETAAQRKARLKAEQEAAAQAEAQRKADEEAASQSEPQQAAGNESDGAGDAGAGEEDEVF